MSTHILSRWIALGIVVSGTGCLTDLRQETAGHAIDPDEFAFADFEPDWYESLPRIDAAGVPLVGTSIVDRDRDLDPDVAPDYGDDQYTLKSPNTQLDPLLALRIRGGVVRLHNQWEDDIADFYGYPVCAHQVLPAQAGDVDSLPFLDRSARKLDLERLVGDCTVQRVWWADRLDYDPNQPDPILPETAEEREEAMTADGELPLLGSRKVFEIVFPERLLINFDEPVGFPNGRVPWEQVNDKVISMGLVSGGIDLTLDEVHLNGRTNDVAFQNVFPYLGAAHTSLPGRNFY